MGTLIVVDCEAPFGVGSPSVGDMTEFGAVDVNALREGRTETFHGKDCSQDTFAHFREWLEPRSPVVFVSDDPAYDFQWINFYFWRYFGMNPIRAFRTTNRRFLRRAGWRFSEDAELEAAPPNEARSSSSSRCARERRGADSPFQRRALKTRSTARRRKGSDACLDEVGEGCDLSPPQSSPSPACERAWPVGHLEPRIVWFLGWCRTRRDLP
jgi:hypothetical protein